MLNDPQTYVESLKSTEIRALIRERRKLLKFIVQYNEKRNERYRQIVDTYRSCKGETLSPSEDEKNAEEQQYYTYLKYLSKLNELMDAKCVFEYETSASFVVEGEPVGDSISLYESGEVVRRHLVFWDHDCIPKSETVLATIPELAETIRSIINSHSRQLKNIPSILRNGTLDGSCDCFRFGDKTITAWTIQRTDPSEVKKRNPEYYRHFKKNMEYENTVLDIYDEIAEVINAANAKIYLPKF